jgi:hypothetical protein
MKVVTLREFGQKMVAIPVVHLLVHLEMVLQKSLVSLLCQR